VELDVGKVGEPDQGRQVFDHAIVDLAVALAGHRSGSDPLGAVAGAALLVEVLALDPVGIALQGQRPAAQVGQQDLADAGVPVDQLALGEARLGVEHLVEVGKFELASLDRDRGFAPRPFLRPCGHRLPLGVGRPLQRDLDRGLVLAQALVGGVADHALLRHLPELDLGDQAGLDEARPFRRLRTGAEGTLLLLEGGEAGGDRG
jgi:hypothetical protein